MSKVIHLTFVQRMMMSKHATCPNCKGNKFTMKNIPMPKHPLPQMRQRPIIKCTKCGYWTDWFDGWDWHPPEETQK